jgi:demethylmenaquinone methyltransferase/2-methoxy-6-polyprenyl-1,4-benzoquinol methylase
MIESLNIPPGSAGLDAGCGIGSHTGILIENAGENGLVLGMDTDFDALLTARNRPGRRDGSYLRGDLMRLPFSDRTIDWAVSIDCIGMMPERARDMIAELAQIVKPGGLIAVAAWTSQMLLPGYPVLEAHLNTTVQGLAPFTSGTDPSLHYLRFRTILEEAGLQDIAVRSFLGDIHAPDTDREAAAIASLYFMRWGDNPAQLPDEERTLYRSLIDPASEGCIYRRPDYYAWFIYTLFTGRRGREAK